MRRRLFAPPCGILGIVGVLAAGYLTTSATAAEPPEIKFPVGKETTVAVGPLDKDGYVDYEAALNERLGKGITPEKNANVLLWKALGPRPEGGKGMPPEYFEALGIPEPPAEGDYFVGMYRFSTDRLKLEGNDRQQFDDAVSRTAKQPWATAEWPDVTAWIAANQKPLAVVAEAVKRPDYFNPLRTFRVEKGSPSSLLGCLLPNVQKNREFAAALAARAMARVYEGRFDDAWRDILTCQRLARHLSRGATLIEYLVAVAIEGIAAKALVAWLDRVDLPADQLRERWKEWKALPPTAPVGDKFGLGERFMYLDCVQFLRRGGVSDLEALAGGKRSKPTEEEKKSLTRVDWEPALRDGNKWYDRMVEAAKGRTRAERTAAFAKIERDVTELKKELTKDGVNLAALLQNPGSELGKTFGNVLIGLLLPASSKIMDATDRCEQVARNLDVAFALALYRKETGGYPAKLADLAPKYLPVVPDDLFTGKPLVYQLEGKGYLFYSVGAHGKDGDKEKYGENFPPDSYPSVRVPVGDLKK